MCSVGKIYLQNLNNHIIITITHNIKNLHIIIWPDVYSRTNCTVAQDKYFEDTFHFTGFQVVKAVTQLCVCFVCSGGVAKARWCSRIQTLHPPTSLWEPVQRPFVVPLSMNGRALNKQTNLWIWREEQTELGNFGKRHKELGFYCQLLSWHSVETFQTYYLHAGGSLIYKGLTISTS